MATKIDLDEELYSILTEELPERLGVDPSSVEDWVDANETSIANTVLTAVERLYLGTASEGDDASGGRTLMEDAFGKRETYSMVSEAIQELGLAMWADRALAHQRLVAAKRYIDAALKAEGVRGN